MSSKPIQLYSIGTQNGAAVSLHLEELKDITPGFDYDFRPVDLRKGEQKEPWFLELNPNARIPVIVDRSRHDFRVFESSAILLYLSQHYDKEHKLWFDPVLDPESYSEMLQWILFAHGGIGPMQGQSVHFNNFAPEDIPYAKKRYIDEIKRLYGVLEVRLSTDRDYLAGPGRGKYSIADVKTFASVHFHKFSGIGSLDEWPNLKAWVERCAARAGSQRGLAVGKII